MVTLSTTEIHGNGVFGFLDDLVSRFILFFMGGDGGDGGSDSDNNSSSDNDPPMEETETYNDVADQTEDGSFDYGDDD